MTFWKSQNYGTVKEISGCQRWGAAKGGETDK